MVNSKIVFSNLIWKYLERSGAQFITFAVSIMLARILSPADYGTMALITVFIAILQVFVDSGLGNALIQKKDADNLDFSTVFFVNLGLCILLYLLIFFVAPYIADFYRDQALTAYLRVLSLMVILSGVKNVQQAYVSKNMMFRKFFFSTLGGTVSAGVIGIFMAMHGFGIWSLIVQQVLNVLIDTLILWLTVNWRPKFAFSYERLGKLFSYGGKLLLSSLLYTLYNNVRQLLIGRMYTASDLAFYNQGQKIPNFIVTNVNSTIDSVLLPAMANAQEHLDLVKKMTRRSIKISAFIMSPVMIGLVFVSEPLIELLLTDKWLSCIPYVRIFCVTSVFYPIHTANLNAIKALGKSSILLKMEICKSIIGTIILLCTIRFGVMAMAYSLLLSSLCSQLINSWPNKKLLAYGYLEQMKDIIPCIALSAFMGVCIYPIAALGLSNSVTLLLQVSIGSVMYLGSSFFFKMDSLTYLYAIAHPYVAKLKRRGS